MKTTVKELIKALQEEDPNMEIWHYNERSGRYHPGVDFHKRTILRAGFHFTDKEDMWVEGPDVEVVESRDVRKVITFYC
jgi:hypothetical protein